MTALRGCALWSGSLMLLHSFSSHFTISSIAEYLSALTCLSANSCLPTIAPHFTYPTITMTTDACGVSDRMLSLSPFNQQRV